MVYAGLTKALGKGEYKIFSGVVAGPSSYTAGGFNIVVAGLSKIHNAIVSLKNNPGNKLITYTISGNTITVKIYTISADTNTGAISATEDADGTDESSLLFEVIAIGE